MTANSSSSCCLGEERGKFLLQGTRVKRSAPVSSSELRKFFYYRHLSSAVLLSRVLPGPWEITRQPLSCAAANRLGCCWFRAPAQQEGSCCCPHSLSFLSQFGVCSSVSYSPSAKSRELSFLWVCLCKDFGIRSRATEIPAVSCEGAGI